jgi:hypothetical protein
MKRWGKGMGQNRRKHTPPLEEHNSKWRGRFVAPAKKKAMTSQGLLDADTAVK